MSEGLIDPGKVPVPNVKPEALRDAAKNLKGDGSDISQTGQDIKSAWGGLDGIYSAPEAPTLFSAIDPVATKGDDVDSAATTAGDALSTFADDAERIKGKLETLKADAQSFVDDVEGDDDWREDEDKVEEHNGLNNDILAALHEYQEAERTCANKITALFGGTTFVATEAGSEPSLGSGEQAYGTTEALEDVKTPWATPQEYDAPWYEDAWNGVKDFGVGIAEDLGAMVGLYGEDGWGVSSWSDWGNNLKNTWGDTLKGLGSLVGFYGKDGWGVSSFGEWASNAGNGWKEFAHAIVPWREWGDRPGYVITQSVLNIGSMALGGAGVVKALAKGARKVGGDGGSEGNGDTGGDGNGRNGDDNLSERLKNAFKHPGDTAKGLKQQLDQMNLGENQIEGMKNALNKAKELAKSASPFNSGSPVEVHLSSDSGGGGGSGGSGGSGGDEGRGGSDGKGGSGGDEGKGGDEGRPEPGEAPEGDPEETPEETPEGKGEEPTESSPEGGGDPGSPGGPEDSPETGGESFPDYDGPKYSDLEVPQGLTPDQFTDLTEDLRDTVGHLDGEIVVQGSRATGLAKETSDIDIGIRIDPDRFDEFASERFGSPNPGSAKEKTMLHALETGKIQAGEAGLRALRKRLEAKLGMEVDVSVLSKGGQFDRPPFIKVDGDA